MNSGKPVENSARVDRLLSRCTVLDAKATTASVYAQVRLQLKKKGTPIPSNDIWIAAICVEHSLPIATEDAHLSAVEGLKMLSPPK